MHSEAWDWIAKFSTDEPIRVLDIGGRNINGSPRELFPNAQYTVLDILPGDGVNIVANAATWQPRTRRYDIVIAAEVFEHTMLWRMICLTAWRALWPGGRFIITTAAPGRPPHSAIDGQELREGEWYENIKPDELQVALDKARFIDVEIDELPYTCDVRAVATKPTLEGRVGAYG